MTKRAALITGGSRGIGAAIAERLTADGFNLTLVARNSEPLEATVARLRAHSEATVRTVAMNMADEARVRDLVDLHQQAFGRLDLLVLSAGVGTAGPVAETTMRAYQRTMDVNFRAAFVLIQESLSLLREAARRNPKHGAKIIALSSLTGVVGEGGLGVYGASKAALISLCETVSLEESAHGVSATAISPGYVDTDMSAWKHGEITPDSMLKTDDVAEMALAVARLSSKAVIPNIPMSRAGKTVWRA